MSSFDELGIGAENESAEREQNETGAEPTKAELLSNVVDQARVEFINHLSTKLAAAEAEVLQLKQKLADEYEADKQTMETVEKMEAEVLRLKREWIPVADKLPIAEEKVLTYGQDGYTHLAYYRPESEAYRFDCDTYGLTINEVSYWMPLPVGPLAKAADQPGGKK